MSTQPRLLLYAKGWLRLTRWPNVLITVFTLLALYYAVWLPAGIVPCPAVHLWYIIGIGSAALAAGNVVNDIYDRQTDAINKPSKVVVGRHVTARGAWTGYALLLAVGAVLSWILADVSGQWWWLSLWGFVNASLWLYSARLKCIPLLGNIAVALMCAGVPFMLWLHGWGVHRWLHAAPNTPTQLTWWYMYFAGVATLLREIVKDCEDREGDLVSLCRTLPLSWGLNRTLRLCWLIAVLLLAGEWWLLLRYTSVLPVALYVVALLLVPTLYLLQQLFRATTPQHFARLSQLLKGLMVAGLVLLLLPGT